MNKQALRSAIRAKKRAMTEQDIRSASRTLAQMLFAHPLYRHATAIYGYLSYNQEVRTDAILAQALRDGKRVAVPRVSGDTMKFLWIDDLSRVKPGFAGIPEPLGDEPEADDPRALVLMPGLAFDREGRRVGYGGGFYDRFLAREPDHPTLALCYGFQMVDKIETEAFDLPVDTVLWADAKKETEK